MIHQSDLDCLHVLTKNWPFVFSFNFFLILKNLLIQWFESKYSCLQLHIIICVRSQIW